METVFLTGNSWAEYRSAWMGTGRLQSARRTKAAARSSRRSRLTGLFHRLFSWSHLLTVRALALILGGGFRGFGTEYAGGATSGQGISGSRRSSAPSLSAVAAFSREDCSPRLLCRSSLKAACIHIGSVGIVRMQSEVYPGCNSEISGSRVSQYASRLRRRRCGALDLVLQHESKRTRRW